MMATMTFNLVSPERNMASGDATLVVLPGVEGDLGAMPGHAPFLTTLRPGIVTATIDGAERRFVVYGGFAEIAPDAVTVLADDVEPAEDLAIEALDERIATAEQALGDADGDAAPIAAQKLSDLRGLKQLQAGGPAA